MIRRFARRMLLACAAFALIARPALADDDAEARAEQLFAHKVLKVFQTKCFSCHGEDAGDVRGEYNMLTREGLLKGGESEEPAIAPGNPEESPLFLAIQWDGLEMPPKENDRLTDEQIAYVRDWIAGGAPWPDEARIAELLAAGDPWSTAEGVLVTTSGGLTDEWTNRRYKPENLWEYQPLWTDESGRLSNVANPIDALIGDRLEELGLEPAPPADRRTLIRRATFDLIGLPPTPAEIDDFVNDPADDDAAFSKVVERLLASPNYGEQWGRHWLDVVRYADSSGYANDYERGNAWRYRDYVVRAFNDDKPYDRFIREQLAGDEIDSSNPELLVAVGFLRMGPWELTGMEVARVARQRFLDDVTNSVGQVFLGHMLRCARCHDHKFDPVPTRDYYSIQAVFATTQLAERPADFLPEENTSGFEERKYLEQRQQFYQQALRELDAKQTIDAAREWFAENNRDSTAFEEVVAELQSKSDGDVTLDKVRRLMAQRNVYPDLIPPRHVGFNPQDFGMERVARKGIERMQWRLERYEPIAFSVYDGRTPELRSVNAPQRVPDDRMTAGELEQTCILAHGDPFSPTEPVEPGVLSATDYFTEVSIPDAGSGATGSASASQGNVGSQSTGSASGTPRIPDSIEDRRLALAEWIASEQNPLTARVMVNRIWQWHFGRAIAGNPNNFGTSGKQPTHPELLDWLAGRFMAEGWSVKSMHRLIMSSAAYRRGSEYPDPALLAQRDPEGTSYAVFQPRRLDAEELRDTMLSVSGELNPAIGGIPVRPEMNLEAALQPRMVMGTFAEAWQPSPLPEERHRRSLYALRLRGQRDPFLEVFNAPAPDISCEAREASTVTPQVFAMFNSEISFDRALALADRVLKEQHSRSETIDRLFRLTYGRHATPDETAICLDHWDRMTARHETLQFDPTEYPQEVVREAVEENTGEKFTFAEPLEFYADFVPDLKPSDVGPYVRGLAEVCLVLLNSNEFAYVY
jgi:mono/diheme cytochrome c family protein